MLTRGWRIRAVFAVVLVYGAVLVGARAPAPLVAAGEVVFRIGGTSNDHSNGRWTIWRHCRGARSAPGTVMAPR
jgi:hypothetical protein